MFVDSFEDAEHGFEKLTPHPDLAKEWHPTKNGNLTPQDIGANSCKKVWWQCDKNHEWETSITMRAKGLGCPYCNGKLLKKPNKKEPTSFESR